MAGPEDSRLSVTAVVYFRDVFDRYHGGTPQRRAYVLGEITAGRTWHPKTYGEVRAAIQMAIDAGDGIAVARQAFSCVGHVLEEDMAS